MKDTDKRPRPQQVRNYYKGGAPSAVYGVGMIGALIYYLQHAGTFWMGVLGILKALIWPAFLVYDLLKFLHS